MKTSNKTIVISGVAMLVLGLILLIFPTLTAHVICYTIAAAFLVLGIFMLITYFTSDPYDSGNKLVIGLMSLSGAVLFFTAVNAIISIIPVILGFIILFSGLMSLQQAIDCLRIKRGGWLPILIIAIINLILAILCLANPFTSATVLMSLIGIGLLFSGISDIVGVMIKQK